MTPKLRECCNKVRKSPQFTSKTLQRHGCQHQESWKEQRGSSTVAVTNGRANISQETGCHVCAKRSEHENSRARHQQIDSLTNQQAYCFPSLATSSAVNARLKIATSSKRPSQFEELSQRPPAKTSVTSAGVSAGAVVSISGVLFPFR